MANSVDSDQTAPIGAVCSGSKLFASILNSSLMLGNYLQQTTSIDDIFRCIFFLFLGALRGKKILKKIYVSFAARYKYITQDTKVTIGGQPIFCTDFTFYISCGCNYKIDIYFSLFIFKYSLSN